MLRTNHQSLRIPSPTTVRSALLLSSQRLFGSRSADNRVLIGARATRGADALPRLRPLILVMLDRQPASSLTVNTLANFAGRGFAVVINFCLVPVYVRMLGVEAYGLVAFSATLNSLFSLLDVGLTTTINRELARVSVDPAARSEARTIVRTLETLYWPVGLLIAVVVLSSSGWLSRHWLNAHALDPVIVNRAVQLMGLQIAMMWPYSLYEGGLLGLQHQVAVNMLYALGAAVRGFGALIALSICKPTILVFLGWQTIAAGILTGAVVVLLWLRLPPSASRPTVDLAVLRRVRAFTFGMAGISLVSLVLTQLDKVVLSKMLPLDRFGYYMLATSVAAALTNCATPFFISLLPRFVQIWASRDDLLLAGLYHRASQALAVVVVPIGLVVSLFATDLVRVWTGDSLVARQTGPLVSILVIGYTFNSLMVLPYALQLASGWTSLAYYQNLLSVVFLGPLLIAFTRLYQGLGAAFVWLLLNIGYFAICVPLTHRRILRGEERRWYLDDVGRPALVALIVLVSAKEVSEHATGVAIRLIVAGLGWLATVVICLRTLPAVAEVATRLMKYVSPKR
jgi:O-antigen/teichoic acid export membrane protein